jgi:hypothetical protein
MSDIGEQSKIVEIHADYLSDLTVEIECLTAQRDLLRDALEVALPFVERAAEFMSCGPVCSPVDRVVDQMRDALAKPDGVSE